MVDVRADGVEFGVSLDHTKLYLGITGFLAVFPTTTAAAKVVPVYSVSMRSHGGPIHSTFPGTRPMPLDQPWN
jgi:hypothetical protein